MKGIIKKFVPVMIAVAIAVTGICPSATYAKAQTHTVTIIYGTTITTQQVKHGGNAVLPTNTAVPGFAFSGWIGNATNVTEDRVILGAYNKDGYLNYATADSNVVVSKYGLPVFKQEPTVKINNNKTAPFPTWWADLNIPKGVPGKTCAVHFYNGATNEYWMTKMVPYGGSLADPGNPCLGGYHFIGWEGDWTNVTEDRCIRAWYFRTYHIRVYSSVDGALIDEQNIRKGENMRTGNEPWYEGYRFDHYEGATENIQADADIVAVYVK